jgi:hypothetical protein
MTLQFSLLSQRDSQWAAKKLGTSNVTIGGYGCLLTCLSMVAKYYGHTTNPDLLNQALNGVGGYAQQNLYVWGSLTKIYSDITETKNIPTPDPVTDSQWAQIDAELQAGHPVICEVDFIPATSAVDMHFVCIIGHEGDQWIVADPWYGDSASLTRYGVPAKTVQRLVFTSGPVPQLSHTDTPITDDQKRALGIVERFKTATNQGNDEGAANTLVGAYNDLQNAVKTISEAQTTIQSQNTQIAGQQTTISAQKDQLDQIAQKIDSSADFPTLLGEIDKLKEDAKNWEDYQANPDTPPVPKPSKVLTSFKLFGLTFVIQR